MINELIFVKHFTIHLILKPYKTLSININLGHGFALYFFYKEEKMSFRTEKYLMYFLVLSFELIFY